MCCKVKKLSYAMQSRIIKILLVETLRDGVSCQLGQDGLTLGSLFAKDGL
jgi:hypothetical protein